MSADKSNTEDSKAEAGYHENDDEEDYLEVINDTDDTDRHDHDDDNEENYLEVIGSNKDAGYVDARVAIHGARKHNNEEDCLDLRANRSQGCHACDGETSASRPTLGAVYSSQPRLQKGASDDAHEYSDVEEAEPNVYLPVEDTVTLTPSSRCHLPFKGKLILGLTVGVLGLFAIGVLVWLIRIYKGSEGDGCCSSVHKFGYSATRRNVTEGNSSEAWKTFFTDEKGNQNVNVLSVARHSPQDLVAGQFNDNQLVHLTLTDNDNKNSTLIHIDSDDQLRDATWTAQGNIAITTVNSKKVIVQSLTSGVVAQTQMTDPRYFSVSMNDVIYLADAVDGVYESTNGGETWSHVFSSSDGWQCQQAVKVSNDKCTEDYVVTETRNTSEWRLGLYTVSRQRPTSVPIWRNISIPYEEFVEPSLCRLAYDGQGNVFLATTNKEFKDQDGVHKLSAIGQYDRQLNIYLGETTPPPQSISVVYCNSSMTLLYVGIKNSEVKVFTLLYSD